MSVKIVSVRIGLPFGLGEISGDWAPDDRERDAAWEMYVELTTHEGAVGCGPTEGPLHEALSSLYSVFAVTRDILRQYGPGIARPTEVSTMSFGHLAVSVLNHGLMPTLAAWHPRLDEYEQERPEQTSRLEWERAWDRHDEIQADLSEVSRTLSAYAGVLAEVCGIKDLLALTNDPQPQPNQG